MATQTNTKESMATQTLETKILSIKDRSRLVGMKLVGQQTPLIAAHFGISQRQVQRIVKHYRNESSVIPKQSPGLPKKLD